MNPPILKIAAVRHGLGLEFSVDLTDSIRLVCDDHAGAAKESKVPRAGNHPPGASPMNLSFGENTTETYRHLPSIVRRDWFLK